MMMMMVLITWIYVFLVRDDYHCYRPCNIMKRKCPSRLATIFAPTPVKSIYPFESTFIQVSLAVRHRPSCCSWGKSPRSQDEEPVHRSRFPAYSFYSHSFCTCRKGQSYAILFVFSPWSIFATQIVTSGPGGRRNATTEFHIYTRRFHGALCPCRVWDVDIPRSIRFQVLSHAFQAWSR